MEIHFDNWAISTAHSSQIAQFDNGCHTIRITGNIPEGYSWDLLMQSLSTDHMNIVSLSAYEGGLAATLSANDLSDSGCYNLQLRGTSSVDTSVRRHTNVIDFFVNHSLSGDTNWPVLPTKFSQMEARIQSVASHPPIPDENGYWQVWNVDGQAYQSTELPVALQGLQGQPGEKGDKGDTGEKGEKGDKGDTFTYADFTAEQLATLKGDKGDKGDAGATGTQGPTGATGAQGPAGPQGATGATGKSAYASAQDGGYAGTEAQFNADLAAVSSKQSTLTAGDNICITDNVIKTKAFPCNPNLLDNWYFGNPVNQRGKTGTITFDSENSANNFFYDRWKVTSGSVTINADKSITINGSIAQVLENTIGQTVTATALTANGISEVIPAYDDTTHTLTITASGKNIKAVKLELGTQQTLARQENGVWLLNEIPDYGEQLRRCQRYYYQVCSGTYRITAVGTAFSRDYAMFQFPFPVSMREFPVPVFGGTTQYVEGEDVSSIWNVVLSLGSAPTLDCAFLKATKTGEFTANHPYVFKWGNDTYIAFTADL